MKIYTRTGDEGKTGLIGGRVSKDDVRVEAYGTVDELNAFVGEAVIRLDAKRDEDLIQDLTEIQHELFDAGADLAQAGKSRQYKVSAEMVTRLEEWIDKYDAECKPLQRFILPGGSPGASALHVCRVVARRAERRVVTLCAQQETNDEVRRYLNRLSDFFFTAARAVNARANVSDVEYKRGSQVFRQADAGKNEKDKQ
ncbi:MULTISPECIES: cob(I)yrinic acid a,c-diamide adenosyltransferase [Thermoactinomyces]|jgi:cob(I)alamin adenosyltransferase|uniref:Corrinoid adenosyltransferase n=1 Tax=Thermoactinomyces daqus TaxID=1329516 RepID=A0A7W2AHJ1_9BACL|nr:MULTISPECIES: cob(I)yrinic acid a,c-diamide adenosyltransferase [Thermoactinomyces]MBA4542791.1 cob(I)yrinic acid a,c-diamide adenosyltransferase [Thermoactinomyces daqus]MBH8598536.1 cob(I)yrinic acid a,c-diamide adenosyltransferase [Thermoactinomyces sp. CICC 10523]MBH8604620.1 cob(I)yrinic acid a,c-diamide adenosyltransferase [Thermoactinomyces sp. CICC 10522]MBH8606920.1 cob(I)yrinic acid a,c-diamide adenosyltransferase [Thermoactinomyces sp. CICC 10521]